MIEYRQYRGDADLPHIMALVQSELSEPYVIYTFRYFLHQWPHLSFLAFPSSPCAPTEPTSSPSSALPKPRPVGVIVCKQSVHRDLANRGYIAMLSVDRNWRKQGIASALVNRSIKAMQQDQVDEIVLETEHDNAAALALYESLGFIREKRLHRFYLNGKDAFRLVLAVPALPFSVPAASSYDDAALASAAFAASGDEDDIDLYPIPSTTQDSPYTSDGTPPADRYVGHASRHRLRQMAHRVIRVSPYSDDDDDVSGR